MRGNSRPGFTLVEVLVAVALIALASQGIMALLAETTDVLRLAASREREVANAAEALTRISTWSRSTLESRIGGSRINGIAIRVAASSSNLFDVSVMGNDGVELLTTTLYRPDDAK
jgi:prepilin-type N-terminal cleavage/methylation domain-containing protein